MEKKQNFKMSEVIILVLLTFIVSLLMGVILGKKTVFVSENSISDKNIQHFYDNYDYILKNYYKDVNKKTLINGAIKGMMESLDDPYSIYFDSSQSSNFNITLDGEYDGLGIEYYQNSETNEFIVSGIFKDSPAFKAGLELNDIILGIDSIDLSNSSLEKLSDYVKNSKTSEFKLKVKRGTEIIDISVSKSKININSVTSEMFEKNNHKIGYIYISIFANNTYEQFKKQLNALEEKEITDLIIDVRQNTGGHLLSVESILKEFLTKKQIIYILEEKGKKEYVYGKSKQNKNYNIVLLGDKGSASASEVLISSLKENLNSYFIGEKTYGKGTVQELITLSNDTQYKITTQKWLTSKGNWINDNKGILPDLEVSLDKKYYETYNKEDDNQLQSAINYIVSK